MQNNNNNNHTADDDNFCVYSPLSPSLFGDVELMDHSEDDYSTMKDRGLRLVKRYSSSNASNYFMSPARKKQRYSNVYDYNSRNFDLNAIQEDYISDDSSN